MPCAGLSFSLSTYRVPKLSSFFMIAVMRSSLTSSTTRAISGFRRVVGGCANPLSAQYTVRPASRRRMEENIRVERAENGGGRLRSDAGRHAQQRILHGTPVTG